MLSLALVGCGAGNGQARLPAPPAGPAVSVVASNVPTTQLVAQVGSGHVRVTDLSQGAPDDRTVSPTAAQVAAVKAAALVVEVGGGYQPALEAAVHQATGSGRPRVLELVPTLRTADRQFWLDPPSMGKAAGLVAGALSAVDPGNRSAYRQGATDTVDAMASLQIDFQSALADCPHTLLVVPDGAFSALAARDGLQLVTVPPAAAPAQVSRVAARIRSTALPTVFSEPPVADPALADLARQTHVAVHALDTLDGPPPDVRLAGASYGARMENDLRLLTGGLSCSSSEST